MIYTQEQKDSIIYQSQVWLGNLGEQITSIEESMQPCADLYCKGYTARVYIQAIQRNDAFVASTPPVVPAVEVGLKDWQIENMYTCLVEITGIKDYPVAIPIVIEDPPAVIIGQPGPIGPAGADGIDGTSANIEVTSSIPSILINSFPKPADPSVTIYDLVDNTYIEPTVSLSLDPATSVNEIGNVIDTTMNMDLFKGRDDVLTSIITSPGGLDAAYQLILDLATLNAGGPTGRSIVASGIIATTTFIVNISDGAETNQASKTKTFVYPFFWGSTPTEPINVYSDLTKSITTKSNKSVNYNDTDAYFWFCYPATYGDLTSIKDQNGFEVLGSFTKTVENVTSTGLVNNYTQTYNIYRTTAKTDINGTFTFSF